MISAYAEFDKKPRELFVYDNSEKSLSWNAQILEDMSKALDHHGDAIVKAIFETFNQEISAYHDDFDWLTPDFINNNVQNFINNLDMAFLFFKQIYINYEKERDFLFEATHGTRAVDLQRRLGAVNYMIAKMLDGENEFYFFNYLSDHGFLPNYGFASSNVSIQMYKSTPPNPGDRFIQRENDIAIREFAPLNSIYFMGTKYFVNSANFRRSEEHIAVEKAFLCSSLSANRIWFCSGHFATLSFLWY